MWLLHCSQMPMVPHQKPRPPVLVIQSDAYNAKIKNVVVAAITTNLSHASDPASFLIKVNTPDGKKSGLRRDSVVSCINLATIEDGLVAKTIGEFSVVMMQTGQ